MRPSHCPACLCLIASLACAVDAIAQPAFGSLEQVLAQSHPAVPPPGADGPYRIDYSALAPTGQQIGWYGGLTVGVLKPRLDVKIVSPGSLDPSFPGPTAPPTTSLDWLGAPEFTLGYRLPNAAGDVQLGYRLAASQGRGTVVGFDSTGDGAVRTRLNVNTVDLDYVLPEFLTPEAVDTSRAFRREWRAGFGVRTATGFFDTLVNAPTTLEARASSTFWGVGPRAFWEGRQHLGDRPAWLYGRITAAGLVGAVRQDFAQTVLNPDGSTTAAGFNSGRKSTGVGVGGFEAGLSWNDPCGARNWRLTAAYSWERWWNFGKTDSSRGELTLQGVILRVEYRY